MQNIFLFLLNLGGIIAWPLLLIIKLVVLIVGIHWTLWMLSKWFGLLITFMWYALAYLFPFDLSKDNYGKWVIITGGTDGIGKAYAEAFAKRGKNLLILSRSQKKMDELTKLRTHRLEGF